MPTDRTDRGSSSRPPDSATQWDRYWDAVYEEDDRVKAEMFPDGFRHEDDVYDAVAEASRRLRERGISPPRLTGRPSRSDEYWRLYDEEVERVKAEMFPDGVSPYPDFEDRREVNLEAIRRLEARGIIREPRRRPNVRPDA